MQYCILWVITTPLGIPTFNILTDNLLDHIFSSTPIKAIYFFYGIPMSKGLLIGWKRIITELGGPTYLLLDPSHQSRSSCTQAMCWFSPNYNIEINEKFKNFRDGLIPLKNLHW